MNTTMNRNSLPVRASSQVSIYDYPEHLNPFYEDDNHKRLRFWKMGSSKGKTGRSNSFSLNGLKEIWAFKSFKMKKRSSTLGINKTSESPPMLRRQVHPVHDTYNTVDSRMRHTVDVGLGQHSNFQRGAGYRSSLQDVHSSGSSGLDNGFYRNDRYRSTMQTGQPTPNRYLNNGGSVTPTPRTKYGQLSHGSSQNSLSSTNPFDDDDYDTISRVTTVDGVAVRKPGRKKRRAPPPPPPPRSSTPLLTGNTSSDITTLDETSHEGSGKEDMAEIHNLTAEIESFVRHADTDEDKLRESPEKSATNRPAQPIAPRRTSIDQVTQTTAYVSRCSPPTRDYRTRNSPPTQIVTTKVTMTSRSSPETQPTEERNIEVEAIVIETKPPENRIRPPTSTRISPENNDEYPVDGAYQRPERDVRVASRETSPVELKKFSSEKQLNVNDTTTTISQTTKSSPPKIIIRKATEDYDDSLDDLPLPAAPIDTVATTPRSTEVEFILEREQHEIVRTYHTPQPQTVDELKITESTEDLTADDQSSTVDLEKYKIRYVPLRNFTPEPEQKESSTQPINSTTTINSNGHATDELNNKSTPKTNGFHRHTVEPPAMPNAQVIVVRKIPPEPPQRRRSVKDIIASINKCQSLLKINQENGASPKPSPQYASMDQIPSHAPATTIAAVPAASPSNESIVRNINELQAHEKHINQIVSEMERNNNNNNNNTDSGPNKPIDVRHIPIMAERFDEFNNDELFKKCVVRRRDKTDMDWNPLPKPRRSRNLTHEAEMDNI